MSTNNIPFSIKKENHPKLSHICSCEIFSKGLKNKFETPMANEPSVFFIKVNNEILDYILGHG